MTIAHDRSRRQPHEASPTGAALAPRFRTLLLLAGLSALLRWASHPPLDFGWLGWVALVPLFLLVRVEPEARSLEPEAEQVPPGRRDLPRCRVYLAAWLGGLAFWIAAIQWLRLGDPTMYWAWIGLATYLSLYYPVFLWLARSAVHGLRVPLWIATPVAWTGLELVQAHLMSGFAWYHVSHTQYRFLPAIQVSDLGGAYLVSFVVVLVNACIAQCVPPRRLSRANATHHSLLTAHHSPFTAILATACIVAATLVYGFIRLGQADFTEGPRVALIQGNVPQQVKMDPGAGERIFHEHLRLSRRAVEMNGGRPPDLIVWPETMFRYPLVTIADDVTDQQLTELASHRRPASWRRSADATRRILTAMAEPGTELSVSPEHGARLLIGVDARDFEPDETHSYNSAVLVVPGSGIVERYDKLHLVPFGEYLPLRETFPWLVHLTPFERGYGLDEGTDPVWFELDGYHFATIICFEDTVPHVVRRFIAPHRPTDSGRPPSADLDFLVNLTNDGWFHGSSELDQHLITSVFRAVECRTPLLRAVNTGISAIIDGDGRIVQVAQDETGRSKQVEAVVIGNAPLDHRSSLYVAFGDWFAGACLIVAAVLALAGSARLHFARTRAAK